MPVRCTGGNALFALRFAALNFQFRNPHSEFPAYRQAGAFEYANFLWRTPALKCQKSSLAPELFFILLLKDKDSIPCILPDHGHDPTYLFFFSFFIFLFSLRLFCGAFLLSFTPLLFSFITPSSLESLYVLAFPSYEKKRTATPIPVSFRYALYAT
jgi:hypothetical protein